MSSRPRTFLIGLYAVCLLLGLYVLSSGPFCWLAVRHASDPHTPSMETFNAVYQPLDWLQKRSRPVKWAWGGYLNWWLPSEYLLILEDE